MSLALPRRELQALAEIGGAVSSASDREVAGDEVLECLRDIVPYQAASLQAFNPITACHETIANVGYPPNAVQHLDSWFVVHDEAYRFMRDVDRRPLRWRDMPFDYRRLYSAETVWIPLGYDEGVTTCLYDGSGRYTGNLHLNTTTRRHPSDLAMDVLLILQSLLSGVVDVLRTPSWIARSLCDDAHAAFVTVSGHVLRLPGCPAGEHLVSRGALPSIVAGHGGSRPGFRPPRGFLWRDGQAGWHRVRLERLAGGTLVIERSTELPLRLTHREIEVLSLIAQGQTNSEIAAQLVVAVKTVAKHVEHLLDKLECTSRAGLAARAVADGLVVADGVAAP